MKKKEKRRPNQIVLRNVNPKTTDDHLSRLFGQFGTVRFAHQYLTGKDSFWVIKLGSSIEMEEALTNMKGVTIDDVVPLMQPISAEDRSLIKEEKKKKRMLKRSQQQKGMEGYNPAQLILRQISPSLTVAKAKEVFSKFGKITSIYILTKRKKREDKPPFMLLFVTFSTEVEAEKALKEMNGKNLEGSMC